MSDERVTPHAQPFYCPFCGEEDFVPYGKEAGRFYCNSCNRHFLVKFLGIGARGEQESEESRAV